MASTAILWEALRDRGISDVAPLFVRAEVFCLSDVQGSWQRLLDAGVQRWQLELLVAGSRRGELLMPQWRSNQPPVRKRRRASLADALLAGEPAERNRALEELDSEVLAKTTVGPYESRILVWRKLCAKWELPAFPLDERNVRAVGASLKRGRYRSSEQYFSAAASYQLRRLHLTVPSHVKAVIRDCVRSVRRGLGPSELKDSFDLWDLAPAVAEGTEFQAFSWESLPAAVDAVLVAAYFCMREIEMASASSRHLYFQHGQLHMLLPVHKTASQGELTTRALHCGCAVRRQPLCPWHAGARHLQRLEILQGCLDVQELPLFPADDGSALSKSAMVDSIRSALRRSGIQTTRPDESGVQVERFGGHVLRVAGTQLLYLLGLRFDMVQLHGRWSSLAIQKYLQGAPLLLVPGAVAQALSSGVVAERKPPDLGGVLEDPTAAPGADRDQRAKPAQRDAESCMPARPAADIEALRLQFSDFTARAHEGAQTLIVNTRSRRAHLPDESESTSRPELWSTACGILYGNTRFFRTSAERPEWQRCRRCFPPSGAAPRRNTDAGGDSGSDADSSSVLTSSSSSSS